MTILTGDIQKSAHGIKIVCRSISILFSLVRKLFNINPDPHLLSHPSCMPGCQMLLPFQETGIILLL